MIKLALIQMALLFFWDLMDEEALFMWGVVFLEVTVYIKYTSSGGVCIISRPPIGLRQDT